MTIGAIWAQTPAGVIGRDGTMPWHLPEDLRHFADITAGHPVIMGRRTWDSLPERFRPLPGRENLVLTRSPEWSPPGAHPIHSVDDAVAHLAGRDAWVIGGRQVFAAWEALISVAEVTVIRVDEPGDTFAPPLASPPWHVESRDPAAGWHRSRTGLEYRFETHRRADRG
jgi:dihydrofolate reductase